MLKDIKYVLNNENGSPNLEYLLCTGVTLLAIAGMLKIKKGVTSIPAPAFSKMIPYDASFG